MARCTSTFEIPVRTDGALPGMSSTEQAAFVAEGMRCLVVAPQPNWQTRVIWHFKPMPQARGQIRSIGPKSASREHAFQPRTVAVVVSLEQSGVVAMSASGNLRYWTDQPRALSRELCTLVSGLNTSRPP